MAYTTLPAAAVSALLATHPATRDELDAIRDPREPSRFMGVYRHVHGGRYTVTAYRARVLKFFELGSNFDSPEAAARAVVAFYKAHFAPDWRRAFRYRKVIPWRVCRHKGAYTAYIYVRGTPVGVTHADVYGRAPGASERWTWPTAREAKRAARVAMERRFAREARQLPLPHPGVLFWRA